MYHGLKSASGFSYVTYTEFGVYLSTIVTMIFQM